MNNDRALPPLADTLNELKRIAKANKHAYEQASRTNAANFRKLITTKGNTLCAHCYQPQWMHARGRWEWCPDCTREVFVALLCDYCGPESRDGLCDGEMCMRPGTVVGIESGQVYCPKHWERVQS